MKARTEPGAEEASPASTRSNRDNRRFSFLIAATAALVFGSQAWLAQAWGSGVPFWDEWDAEAVALYHPWLAGTLHLRDLFAAHNEHRIVLTRLLDLALFCAYGRWEPWAQIVANAVIHAATAGVMLAFFGRKLPPLLRSGFAAGIALIFSAPCGWQNALHGFQSQVYFANLLAVFAAIGLLAARPGQTQWWLGWSAALVALFSFASGGFIAPAALAMMFAVRWFSPDNRAPWWSLALVGAIPVLSVLLAGHPVEQTPLHAQSVGDFAAVLLRCLSWPFVNSPYGWVIMQAPGVALLGWSIRRRQFAPGDQCALALAGYGLLHAAAIAYSRGTGLLDARPLSRYQEELALATAAQFFCLLRLAGIFGRPARFAAIGWICSLLLGLTALTIYNFRVNLPFKRTGDALALESVRTYLQTHDVGAFAGHPEYPGVHPRPIVVARVLADPLLHPKLPQVFFSHAPESVYQPWLIAHGAVEFWGALLFFSTVCLCMTRPPARDDHPSGETVTPAEPGGVRENGRG